jgi:transcriptional regulator with XRE-family HTH domain
MSGKLLRESRERANMTQVRAATKLRISQPYLSLLERGDRPVSAKLARKAAKLFQSPTMLPLPMKLKDTAQPRVPVVSAQEFAEELAGLGYPGFSYLRSHLKRNPAEVLLRGLAQHDLEPRLTEALPWLVLRYTNLDWDWLVKSVKDLNLQNRLGFVTTLALRVAQSQNTADSKVGVLEKEKQLLEEARLAKEDTMGHEAMPKSEREWLKQYRSDDARHWNLLTDLAPEHFKYARAF